MQKVIRKEKSVDNSYKPLNKNIFSLDDFFFKKLNYVIAEENESIMRSWLSGKPVGGA